MSLIATLVIIPLLALHSTAVVSALVDTTEDVACDHGGTELNIVPNNTDHTVTVTCKDKSGIYYNPSSVQQGLIGLSINCAGSDTVGSQVAKLNAANPKLVLYCVLGAGSSNSHSVKDNVTPVVTTIQAVDAKCPDGVTPIPKGGKGDCPATTHICPDGNTIPVTEDCAISHGNCSDVSKCDLISTYINPFVNLLAAFVGVAVVISIVIGGIQYGSSAGDPQKVSAAKNRIRNAIVALITFLFLYALLNFLIPGGLL